MKKLVLTTGFLMLTGFAIVFGQTFTYSYTGAVQTLTIPACVSSVTITAYGAQGGSANSNTNPGGLGAKLTGTFTVTAAEVLDVIVGSQGTSSNATSGSGGGGGSGVANGATPLIIAGGGGGRDFGGWDSADGAITNTGHSGYGNVNGGAGGGVGGNVIYSVTNIAYGGNGFNAGNSGDSGIDAVSPNTTHTDASWGLGGGGGGVGNGYCNCGGGGGGYSGGGAGGINGDGGGGGSYNGGTNQFDSASKQQGNGFVIITLNTGLPLSVTVNPIPCHGGTGSATVTASGGTPAYTYTWAPSGGSGATANNLTAGTYTITVKDATGCTGTATAVLTDPALLTVTTTINSNVICSGGNSGEITANASGGTAGYTYSWSPTGGSGVSISGLTAGCYTVTLTDANGCTATASTCITQPATLPTVTTGSVVTVSCNGGNNGSIKATPSGGTPSYTFLWSPGGSTNATANNLTAGCYTITVTDNTGCTATASTCISQPTAITGTITPPSAICAGNCTNVTVTNSGGTPAYTYLWNNGATTTTVTVCPAVTTPYTVTTTDAKGCTFTASVTVTINALPTVTLSATKDTECVAVTADALTGSPAGGTYSGTGVTGSNFNPSVAGAGTHSVTYTYTDGNGCSNTDTVKIIVNVCAGINEVAGLEEQVKFYPNPFSESVNVNVELNGPVTLTIFNVMGQNVGAYIMDKGLNTINTSGMASGVYTVQVKTQSGVWNKKLVKVE